MKFNNLIIWALFILLTTSCEKNLTQEKPINIEVFTGFVQKGPFINGSSVSISELDENLNQTGRSYSTTVSDNQGSFEQTQIELVSNYVQIKADGYYFNEVTGKLSTSQLTLYALVDVSDANSANINVLTHLEKPRVEYLIKKENLSFNAAKNQAQKEILQIFNMNLPSDSTSENLNFTRTGASNAMLLAVSAILQGPSTTADLSLLLADIISDIKTDGKLDNASLGSILLDNARLTDMDAVKANLIEQYADLGISNIEIPEFKQYVNNFIENTEFKPEKKINYPLSGSYGANLLCDTFKLFRTGIYYSLKAELPLGTSLRVVLTGKKSSWGYSISIKPENWDISNYNDLTSSQEFKVQNSNQNTDMLLVLGTGTDSMKIDIYENGSLIPNKTKVIHSTEYVKPTEQIIFSYPIMGILGDNYNILHDSVYVTRSGKIYCMNANIPTNKNLKVILKADNKVWIENPTNIEALNWTFNNYNSNTHSQEFYSKGVGKNEIQLVIPNSDKFIVEIYENDAIQPTRIKYVNY